MGQATTAIVPVLAFGMGEAASPTALSPSVAACLAEVLGTVVPRFPPKRLASVLGFAGLDAFGLADDGDNLGTCNSIRLPICIVRAVSSTVEGAPVPRRLRIDASLVSFALGSTPGTHAAKVTLSLIQTSSVRN